MPYSIDNIGEWAGEGEGPAMEFKLSVEKSAGKTISAFANTFGGIMIFGIGSKNNPVGIRDQDEESRRLREILDTCKPNPRPIEEFVKHAGKSFIVLKIEPFAISQTPCFFRGRCFIRQGTTNLELSGEELIDFLKKRTILDFEELRSRASLSDIDISKVSFLLKSRGSRVRAGGEKWLTRVLAGLKAANFNGEFFLKNISMMFFAKNPGEFIRNSEVRIVRYPGRERALAYIKFDKRLHGTIPELIENAFGVVKDEAGNRFVLEGAVRKEIPVYPDDALREVVVNAVGHRDYFDQNKVLVEVFDDRLQVTSPGGLLYGQTIKNFDIVPRHRNPICYEFLQDLGYGEGLGLGVMLMRDLFRKAGLPQPEFRDLGNAFAVVFYNHLSGKPLAETGQLNERQLKLIKYLEKNEKIKLSHYAKIFSVSSATSLNDINQLIGRCIIKRMGKFRGAYYMLKEDQG